MRKRKMWKSFTRRNKEENSTAQAAHQCVRVLANFGDAELREAQERNECLRRLAGLKAQWGEEVNKQELKHQSPEVQGYCRWWPDLYQTDSGVWMMDKVIQTKGCPMECVQVRLVPVAWRENIWRYVHVHSVSHFGYERVYEIL